MNLSTFRKFFLSLLVLATSHSFANDVVESSIENNAENPSKIIGINLYVAPFSLIRFETKDIKAKSFIAGSAYDINDKFSLGIEGIFIDTKMPNISFSSLEKETILRNSTRGVLFTKYHKNSLKSDGLYLKAGIGYESGTYEINRIKSSEKSDKLEGSFIPLSFNVGYQWIWENGINISWSIGGEYRAIKELKRTSNKRPLALTYKSPEDSEVLDAVLGLPISGELILGYKF